MNQIYPNLLQTASVDEESKLVHTLSEFDMAIPIKERGKMNF